MLHRLVLDKSELTRGAVEMQREDHIPKIVRRHIVDHAQDQVAVDRHIADRLVTVRCRQAGGIAGRDAGEDPARNRVGTRRDARRRLHRANGRQRIAVAGRRLRRRIRRRNQGARCHDVIIIVVFVRISTRHPAGLQTGGFIMYQRRIARDRGSTVVNGDGVAVGGRVAVGVRGHNGEGHGTVVGRIKRPAAIAVDVERACRQHDVAVQRIVSGVARDVDHRRRRCIRARRRAPGAVGNVGTVFVNRGITTGDRQRRTIVTELDLVADADTVRVGIEIAISHGQDRVDQTCQVLDLVIRPARAVARAQVRHRQVLRQAYETILVDCNRKCSNISGIAVCYRPVFVRVHATYDQAVLLDKANSFACCSSQSRISVVTTIDGQ